MPEMSKAFEVTLDGIPMAYVSEVSVSTQSEDKPVKTLKLGLAGFSDGAEMATITLKSAIPQTGRERDYKEFCRRHVTKTFGIRGAGKTYTVKGRIISVDERSSVDNPNEIDLQFQGSIVQNS